MCTSVPPRAAALILLTLAEGRAQEPVHCQWQVSEFAFTAATDPAGTPLAVRFDAEFRGPAGEAFTVPGFWDGGKNWKARFTPTKPGEWTYTTRAVEQDARVVTVLRETAVRRGGEPAVEIDVDLAGQQEIELEVDAAGDGSEHDHAHWAEAVFVRRDGSETRLDTLTPERANQGHGELGRGRNLFGQPLRIGDRTYSHGLASHAPGRIAYRLTGDETRLRAQVGVETGVGNKGSVRFAVLGVRVHKADPTRRDPGLHGRTGRFTALPADTAGTALARHGGFLRVTGDGHALAHTDGTPFFWLGDTWWHCPSDLMPIDRSNRPGVPSMYLHLLKRRQQQGFTTVHMAFLGDIGGVNPFANAARGPGLDPAYWQTVDRYVQAANDHGLIPVIGLGWAGRPLSTEDWQSLWRHVIARLGAHAVTWLVCGEYNVRGAEDRVAETLKLGRYIKQTDPWRRAMTIHPWWFGGDQRQAWDEDWLDFIQFQGGHGELPPVELYRDTFARSPARPLLEAECRYEGIHAFTDRDVREAAWRAVMNGSCGFTYGSHGLWYPTQDERDRKHAEWGNPTPWWLAAERPGAAQLGHLRRILESVDWWRLRPRPDFLTAEPDPAGVVPLHDLVSRFGEAKAENAHWQRVGAGEPARIELHPNATGDARLVFPPLTLPTLAPGESLRLVTAFGFSPSARLDDPEHPSNGVTFSLQVNGDEAVRRAHHAKEWSYQQVDLTAHAGREVRIVLGVDANGNTSWDHAAFRRPLVIRTPASQTDPLRAALTAPPGRAVQVKADSDRTLLVHIAPGPGQPTAGLGPLSVGASYQATWFNPRTGEARDLPDLAVKEQTLAIPAVPDEFDWVLRMMRR